MSLRRFSERLFPALAGSTVSAIEASPVYFVHTGRNAWHSTWVKQYTSDCMHTCLLAAKEYCEKRRTQGAVFNIEQIPALIIGSSDGRLIVTQINCDAPLARYSMLALRQDVGPGRKKIENARNNYLQVGAPIIGGALSFASKSRFWKSPGHALYTMVHATDDPDDVLEGLPSGPMVAYTSASVGSAYYLRWQSRKNRYQIDAICRLVTDAVS